MAPGALGLGGGAWANCTTSGANTTCTTASPNPYTSRIGSGPNSASGATVTLQPSAQISVTNASAISLGDNAVIELQPNALVQNNASTTSGSGLWGAGNNTIEFGSNGQLTIQPNAVVQSLGAQNTSEAVNVMGVGNTITNKGTISGNASAAIWFEDKSTGGTNTVDNFGVIQTSLGTTANVIGNNSNGNVTFVNETGAQVLGSLNFASGNDNLTLYAGSVITGSFNGGGGTNSLTLNGAAGSSDSLAGSIQNFQSLIKAGPGMWTLTGSIGNNGGNAALKVEVQQGVLALTGTNSSFNGTVTVDPAGILQARAQSLPPSVTDNGQVVFTQGTAGTYSGVISGTGLVDKELGADLTLSGANTYSGGTVINLGTVFVSSNANLGAASGALAINGGTLGVTSSFATARPTTLGVNNGTFNILTGVTLTDTGAIGGPGGLTKLGGGTLVLNGVNGFAGGAMIDGGTVQVAADSALGAAAGPVEFNGGTLATTANMTTTRSMTLSSGGGTFQVAASTTLQDNGMITGPGALTKTGAGTLILTGTDAYAGGTAINGGAVQISSDANLGAASGPLSFNGGTLITTAGLTSNRATSIGAGGATIDTETADPSNPALTFNLNGVISGAGGLTKTGPGDLTLNGNNTYAGPTTVSNGWLYVDGAQSAATGSTTAQSGARLAGNGVIGGNVEVQGGAYIAPGFQPFTAGTLTINGNLTLDAGSALYFNVVQANVNGGALNDLVVVKGNLTLGGAFYTLDEGQLPPGGTFGPGVYRIIDYSGTLTNPTGLALGSLMAPGTTNPFTGTAERPLTEFFVQTAVPGQVNLVNPTGLNLTYWDGSAAGLHDNGAIDGGNGTWVAPGLATLNEWTGPTGAANAPWANGTAPTFADAGFAIFGGTAGAVTVSDTQASCVTTCQVFAQGMQFITGGYVISGDPIDLVPDSTGASIIRVGDGTTEAAAMTATINSVLAGATALTKTDLGALVLGGANTYTGGTAINGGVLQISSDANLGAAGAGLSFENGTLATTANITTARPVSLNLDPVVRAGLATFQTSASTTLQLDGVVSGAGALAKTGAGTLLLTNNDTYTGGTTISAGTLQVGNGAASGAILGDVVDNGQLILSRSDDITYGGVVSGTGSAVKAGTNTLTLTGDSTFTGGTTIAGGTLQLGNGGTTGGIVGNVVDNGALTFNRSGAATFGGLISGAGAVNQVGPGVTILTANNSYAGPSTVTNGWFYVDGDQTAATGLTTLGANTRLGGNGIVGGNVTMGANTQLGPGSVPLTPATLTINGSLTLNPTTNVLYNLIEANVDGAPLNDLTVVKGNLTVDGVINVVEQGQTLAPGVYRIFDYFGTLTNNGLAVGAIQNAPADPSQPPTLSRPLTGFVVQTSIPGQVNIVNPTGLNLTYWDGGNAVPALKDNNLIDGGNGTWWAPGPASTSNWTDLAGAINAPWDNSGVQAIFVGIGAHPVSLSRGVAPYCAVSIRAFGCGVTVDDSQGQVIAAGLQFATDGYVVTGDAIELVGSASTPGVSTIRVGDGTSVSFAMTATINSVLTGNVNLTKTDLGTLVLNGANTYTGGTTINAGLVIISSDANLGLAGTPVLFDGGGLATTNSITLTRQVTLNPGGGTLMPGNGTTLEVDSAIADGTGPGALTVAGGGVLALAAGNTYSGGTTIAQGGTLQLGAGGASGSILNDVTNDGTLAFDRSDTFTFGGLVSGAGAVSQIGSGTTILTAADTYTGGTAISAGALELGNGAAAGGIVGDVTDNALLIFNRSDTVTFGGVISGTGQVNQAGLGTTILTGNNTYAGVTTISAGTLQLGDGGTSGAIVGPIVNNGRLVVDRSDTLTLPGAITGPGSLVQAGPGVTILTGANTYSGGTTVAAGMLQIGNGGTTGTVFGDIVDNGVLILDRSDTIPYPSAVSGTGRTIKEGAGTLIVTGVGTYTGGTTISQGVLQLGNEGGSDFGFPGAVDTTGATGSILGDIVDNAVLAFNRSNAQLINGVISGTGSVVQMGTGATTFGADETYTGGTTIQAGTLQVGNGAAIGSVVGDVLDNGILVFNRSDAYTFAGVVSGTGQLVQDGPGTLILTGSNTHSGGTSIQNGVLQISSDANLGAASGVLSIGGATLVTTATITTSRETVLQQLGGTFVTADGTTYFDNGLVRGAGGLTKTGAGSMKLSGANLYFGPTNILAGTLYINGDQSQALGLTTVAGGGALGGSGIVGGDVMVQDGGVLAPGNSPGTITINGSLTLTGGSVLNYDFGQASVVGGPLNDLAIVHGNLVLDGTINVLTAPGGTFDPGIYRVISYDGALTDNGLAIGTIPSPSYFVQTSIAHQVNLVNTAGLTLNFWDGAAGGRNDGVISGGNGVWQAAAGNDNWTEATGSLNAPFADAAFAVFSAAPGTVTVDASKGSINLGGAQFASDGYVIQGDTINLVGEPTSPGATIIRVGDGSTLGAGYTATINAPLAGATSLVKDDLGTLVLGGTNTYAGGTVVNAGVLQISSDANLGAAAGGLTLNASTLRTTATLSSPRTVTLGAPLGTFDVEGPQLTLTGVVGGAGVLTKAGPGILTLAAANTYTGGTVIGAGTVQISSDANLGAPSGGVTFDPGVLEATANLSSNRSVTMTGAGTIQADSGVTFTLGGPISGAGALTKAGPGALVLTGDSSAYRGAAQVAAGDLIVDGVLGGTLGVLSGAQLEGTGRVGPLSNSGVVAPGHGDIGTLTVAGAYVGAGGTLNIRAVLGGDDSPASRLVVTGSTSGSTLVTVQNRGGLGAPTSEGIKIVDVGGASNGVFTLQGDYVFQGAPALIAGAYAYQLHKNGVSTPTDGDWYLRSQLTDAGGGGVGGGRPSPPLFQPGAPVYEALPSALLALNDLPTLQQRVGNLSWPGSPVEARGAWVRVEGVRQDPRSQSSTTMTSTDTSAWQTQMGFQAVVKEGADNTALLGGFTARYGQVTTKVSSVYGNGSINADGFGVGGTLTWFGPHGFYADGQALFSVYSSDLNSNTLHQLTQGLDGSGKAFSIELGERIPLNSRVSLTPQFQTVYSTVDFDSFSDPFGAHVSNDGSDSLKSRWGLAVDSQMAWTGASGQPQRAYVYGVVDVTYQWQGGSRVEVSGTGLGHGYERTLGDIGVGATYSWAPRFSVYGEAMAQTALDHFGDSNAYKATVGIRVAF